MIRILEVISDTNIGGAGRLLLARLRQMNRTRFHVKVVVPQESMLKAELIAMGIETEAIDVEGDRSFEIIMILRLLPIIRKFRPHILHAHGSASARIAAFLRNVPVSVYTRHCAFPLSKTQKTKCARWLQQHICRLLSDCVIAVSPAAKENLLQLGIDPRQICVIVNGCTPIAPMTPEKKSEFKKKERIPKDATVVGLCARLEPYKDQRCLLRAAKYLIQQQNGPRYFFLLIGDGSMKKALHRYCWNMGLLHNVKMTGFVKDPSPWLNVFDINVNCSIGTETASLALSEGMSLGIPSVVSDFSGNPYMVREDENGLIYPCGRAEILAKQIERIATDPSLAHRLSVGALQRFHRELNATVMTKKYELLYERLVQRKRKQNNA